MQHKESLPCKGDDQGEWEDARRSGSSKWQTCKTKSHSKTIKNLKKGKSHSIKASAVLKILGKTYYGSWFQMMKTGKIIK